MSRKRRGLDPFQRSIKEFHCPRRLSLPPPFTSLGQLVSDVQVNIRDTSRDTPLLTAIVKRHGAIIKALLSRTDVDPEIKDSNPSKVMMVRSSECISSF